MSFFAVLFALLAEQLKPLSNLTSLNVYYCHVGATESGLKQLIEQLPNLSRSSSALEFPRG